MTCQIHRLIKIPFNKPYFTGKETTYIEEAVRLGKLSGNGYFTHQCHQFFKERYGFETCLLTNSGTDALEMAALLLDIEEGDEVIMPSFTFVSTANAFVLRGAKIVFVDSRPDHPGMDESQVEALITARTKAIVAVHYAGVACDMDVLMELTTKYGLFLVEDAAQAIDSYYKGRPLGGIGHLAAFSFHETKNIHSGEGGMLVVNDPQFAKRAEILWEKGTNRAAFSRKEVKDYSWIDIGSSFLPSEITAAFLFAQLQNLEDIQGHRKEIWQKYQISFSELKENVKQDFFLQIAEALPGSPVQYPRIPVYAANNAHMYYLVFDHKKQQPAFINQLSRLGIMAISHYKPLHISPYYRDKHDGRMLAEAERYAECLVRLPLYHQLLADIS